jgi:hypothetical protein
MCIFIVYCCLHLTIFIVNVYIHCLLLFAPYNIHCKCVYLLFIVVCIDGNLKHYVFFQSLLFFIVLTFITERVKIVVIIAFFVYLTSLSVAQTVQRRVMG